MKLYLMRHGRAQRGDQMDADRPILPKGKKETEAMASFANKMGIAPDVILTSPFNRTAQTADIMASSLGGKLVKSKSLEPDQSGGKALDGINRVAGKANNVLVVSHHNVLREILASLLDTPHQKRFSFDYSGISHVKTNKNNTKGKLFWKINPEVAKAAQVGAEAKSDTVTVKRWCADVDACPICLVNEGYGWVETEFKFLTVDGETEKEKAHDTCTCVIEYKSIVLED